MDEQLAGSIDEHGIVTVAHGDHEVSQPMDDFVLWVGLGRWVDQLRGPCFSCGAELVMPVLDLDTLPVMPTRVVDMTDVTEATADAVWPDAVL